MTDEIASSDHVAVQRCLDDYAWACDNGDWALLRSVFADDAHLDYSSTGGPAGGRDEVVAWLEESLSQVPMIQHVVSNFRIDVGGDDAAGRAMFFTVAQIPGLDRLLMTGGYYELGFRRDVERWKLSRLVEENRWMDPPPPRRP